MNKKHILVFSAFLGLIFLSIGSAYYRFFISRNYDISFKYPCDPEQKVCYRYQCEEDCGDEEEASDPEYYQVFHAPASMLPVCDSSVEDCPLPPVCEIAGSECEIIPCEESPDEGISCTDPVTFVPGEVHAEESENADDTSSMVDSSPLEDGLNENGVGNTMSQDEERGVESSGMVDFSGSEVSGTQELSSAPEN